MSDLALYALVGMLESMGWPRKAGFLGRKAVVNTAILDQAAHQVVQIGVGLGAGRPAVAVRVLSDAFGARDWSTANATELIDELDLNQLIQGHANQRPWKTISPPSVAEMGKTSIPWEWLGEPEIAIQYAGVFVQGIIWGLLYPAEAEKALDSDRVDYEQRAPEWQKAGLEIESQYMWQTNEDFYKYCEEVVNNFESERRPLVTSAAELQAEPRVARRLKGAG